MGADLIKVMSTGGFMTKGSAPWFAQFSLAELTAVVAEAHRLGKRVAAHAHGREGIARAVARGLTPLSTARSPGRMADTAQTSIPGWPTRSPPRVSMCARR
jgi:hypothetical protein